jgi:hypothetical protein
MNRQHLIKALGALIVAALAWWIVQNTEWVEVEVEGDLQGEARTNDLYAIQKLGKQLGATMVTVSNLERMPPQGATLWLDTWYWDMFPGRERQLREWVEGGGHLVLSSNMLRNEHLSSWIHIAKVEPPKRRRTGVTKQGANEEDDDEGGEDAVAKTPAPVASAASSPSRPQHCNDLSVHESVAHAYVGRSSYTLCGYRYGSIATTVPTVWVLEDELGPQVMRVRAGRGLVTVLHPHSFWGNRTLFIEDNALLAVAALGLQRGAQLWWVTEESRPPLLTLVWEKAWIVVALGALALLAALWRGAPRFGPALRPALNARRSMGEQVRGTAAYLQLHGREALHRASLRALEEAARLHLRDYERMGRPDRAKALAQATGLAAADIVRALDPALKRTTGDFLWTLEMLETARRRLRAPQRSSGASTIDKDDT